ncbi:MAG: hypothetical protein GY705_11795 [Bacteroidetes bacterium]|nr:hypothetical protein [Bacteroidota bacterium]
MSYQFCFIPQGLRRSGETEAVVVVPVAWVVVVPIRNLQVLGSVVPTAAPLNTVGASTALALIFSNLKYRFR